MASRAADDFFLTSPSLLGLSVDTAVIGHLDSPVFPAAGGGRDCHQLFMLLLFLTYEHHRPNGAGIWCQNWYVSLRALIQPLLLVLGAA